jgi:outer membrane protein TolC
MANYDDILVSLTAEVARTYVVIRTFENRLAVARENVRLQKESLRLAELRFQEGVATKLDVTQARALLKQTEALIPRLETSLRQAKNGLAILLGILPAEVQPILGNGDARTFDWQNFKRQLRVPESGWPNLISILVFRWWVPSVCSPATKVVF